MIYQNIPKGVAFRVFMCSQVNLSGSSNLAPRSQVDLDASTYKISKDNGTFNVFTNTAVYVNKAIFYIDLTAEEMNADRIDIYFSWQGSNDRFASSVTILTGSLTEDIWDYADRSITGGGTTVQSPAAMTAICTAINDGYIVTQIATGESGYNYYGLTSSKSDWWIIIREKTDFTDVDYKMNKENRQTFVLGWANRATLNYSDTFPLK